MGGLTDQLVILAVVVEHAEHVAHGVDPGTLLVVRVEELHSRGAPEARLYGDDPNDGVGGDGAFFLLLDEPEVYGLPPDPVVPTRDAPAMWKYAGMAASALMAAAVSAFVGRGR